MKWFRRRDQLPWEVVECETVEPVLMFDDDDELEIVRIREADACRKYIFDFEKHAPNGTQCASAVLFARQQLLQEIAKKNYNILLLERSVFSCLFTSPSNRSLSPSAISSWTFTLLRQRQRHRIEIVYTGRPGYVSGKLPPLRPPPFLAVLEGRHMFS
ncbi:hypothetical protein F5I97DRAFT_1813753 [Phlebopus sp. FC_14]|nr:hypothetical protein F5I97DRAFT_1813753 [Phlebopus sp. FC_14]